MALDLLPNAFGIASVVFDGFGFVSFLHDLMYGG